MLPPRRETYELKTRTFHSWYNSCLVGPLCPFLFACWGRRGEGREERGGGGVSVRSHDFFVHAGSEYVDQFGTLETNA